VVAVTAVDVATSRTAVIAVGVALLLMQVPAHTLIIVYLLPYQTLFTHACAFLCQLCVVYS
jgi:hypothetical protein